MHIEFAAAPSKVAGREPRASFQSSADDQVARRIRRVTEAPVTCDAVCAELLACSSNPNYWACLVLWDHPRRQNIRHIPRLVSA
jgi:hypothetical protein